MDGAEAGQLHAQDRAAEAQAYDAVGDAAAVLRGGGVLLVKVHGVRVRGDDAEILDVHLGYGLGAFGGHAELELGAGEPFDFFAHDNTPLQYNFSDTVC